MVCGQDLARGQNACCSFSGGGMGPQVPILGSKSPRSEIYSLPHFPPVLGTRLRLP